MPHETITEKLQHIIHPQIIKMLSIRRGFPLQIDGTIPQGEQFIFVANHYCIDDIPTAGEVIGRHVYALVSDEDKHTMDGIALMLNGVVWTNRLDKAARAKSKIALVRHLQLGHSIIMYPEATWNLTPNLPMLPMNYGCISISLETKVPILPIYFSFDEDACRVKICDPFYPSEDRVSEISRLRDIMAAAAWSLMEKKPMACRNTFPSDYWEQDISKRYSNYARARKDPTGVRIYESQFIFHDKNIILPQDAFLHLQKIIPSRKNAFLFSKSVV